MWPSDQEKEMTPSQKPKKMGRPEKHINWDLFESLCGLQCTQSEIASTLKINVDTLSDRAKKNYKMPYSDVYKKFSESGKCSLRRNQFVLSKKNASMAIFLGKVWLGQKDGVIEEATNLAENAIINAIKQIQKESRADDVSGPILEDQQPLLDQRQRRESKKIQLELGTEDSVGGNECV